MTISTDLSFQLSRALASGRKRSGRADDRKAVLARLLKKRAAARRAGLGDLEMIMRRQIEWVLPIERGAIIGEDDDTA